MNVRCLVDGEPESRVAACDRGLCYGDGLFETVLLLKGHAPLWARHMQRLRSGCRRLRLPRPDEDRLWQETRHVADGLERAVVRITVTRGAGERGYAPPSRPRMTRIVNASTAPDLDPDWYAHGIRVRFCDTRLAIQPALAGLKHLNRLEQVLARAEWDDAGIAEGLMRDTEGRLVCATAANLFAVVDGRLHTPALERCGVAGVARAELLARDPGVHVCDLSVEEAMRADELFLTSSVRGIVPVTRIGDHRLPVGPVTRSWQARWNDIAPTPEAGA